MIKKLYTKGKQTIIDNLKIVIKQNNSESIPHKDDKEISKETLKKDIYLQKKSQKLTGNLIFSIIV